MSGTLVKSPVKPVRRLLEEGKRALFEKDVLRVGHFEGPGCAPWDVTQEDLDQLVQNFERCRADGVRVPVIWGHDEDARAKIGDVASLRRDGDTLVATFWAGLGEDSRRLSDTQPEVSVGVDSPLVLSGKTYAPSGIRHVAVCTHPVVTGQGEFRRLLSEAKMATQTKRRLADEETPAPPADSSGPEDGATEIAVTEVVGMIAKYFDVTLPSDVDTAKELRLVLETMMGSSEAEAADEPPAPEVVEAMPVEEMTLSQSRRAVKALRGTVREFTKREEAQRKLAQQRAKDDFDATLVSAIEANLITEADRQEYLREGAEVGYKPVLVRHLSNQLRGGDRGTAYSGQSKTRRLSQASEPRVPGGDNRASDEDCKAMAAKF